MNCFKVKEIMHCLNSVTDSSLILMDELFYGMWWFRTENIQWNKFIQEVKFGPFFLRKFNVKLPLLRGVWPY